MESMHAARHSMNDYKRIKVSPSSEMYWQIKYQLFPALAARQHEASRLWLQEQLSQGDP